MTQSFIFIQITSVSKA